MYSSSDFHSHIGMGRNVCSTLNVGQLSVAVGHEGDYSIPASLVYVLQPIHIYGLYLN
jgi:hypothetical protein